MNYYRWLTYNSNGKVLRLKTCSEKCKKCRYYIFKGSDNGYLFTICRKEFDTK